MFFRDCWFHVYFFFIYHDGFAFFYISVRVDKEERDGARFKKFKNIKQQALKLCTYVINVCNKIFTVYFSKKRIRSYIILYEVSYFKFSSKMTAFLLYKK